MFGGFAIDYLLFWGLCRCVVLFVWVRYSGRFVLWFKVLVVLYLIIAFQGILLWSCWVLVWGWCFVGVSGWLWFLDLIADFCWG